MGEPKNWKQWLYDNYELGYSLRDIVAYFKSEEEVIEDGFEQWLTTLT